MTSRKTKKELEEVAALDVVNEESKANLADLLRKKHVPLSEEQVKQLEEVFTKIDTDKSGKIDLKELSQPDEETKAEMTMIFGELKFSHFQKVRRANFRKDEDAKTRPDLDEFKRFAQILLKLKADKEHDEREEAERKELAKVAALDVVNKESKANLAGLLAKKHAHKEQHNKSEKEEQKELAEVEALDTVNEESKANLAGLLAKKRKA